MAKKSHNAINIISAISVAGVTIGTFALVVVLSVFNGFDDLIKSLYNSFDPDLKITVVEGKTFVASDSILNKLSAIDGIAAWSKVSEENALLKYGDKQYIAVVKGVDRNYSRINYLDTFMVQGQFVLNDTKNDFAVIGRGVAYYLQIGLHNASPINIYVPRKSAAISSDPSEAFNQKHIFSSGVFAMEQDFDSKYIIVPLRFMNELLEDSLSVSAIEIRTMRDVELTEIKQQVKHLFGPKFKVQTRIEQKEVFYRIMNYEKWAIFFILSFILAIASFNVLASLSMLIIEKKKDISTLHSLGADSKLISRIFLAEGTMISLSGAIFGILLGLLVCWLQTTYGLVKLQGSGSFIIEAYPVSIQFFDIALIFVTVIGIGIFAAWYPVKIIVRKYLP